MFLLARKDSSSSLIVVQTGEMVEGRVGGGTHRLNKGNPASK